MLVILNGKSETFAIEADKIDYVKGDGNHGFIVNVNSQAGSHHMLHLHGYESLQELVGIINSARTHRS